MTNGGNSPFALVLLIGVIVTLIVGLFVSGVIPRREGQAITLPWSSLSDDYATGTFTKRETTEVVVETPTPPPAPPSDSTDTTEPPAEPAPSAP